ncbi:MAG: hypothetical protein RJA22_1145 [Verrucomicrobiota bacterium]|jgi:3-phosphoshikimate 1-carboxyvinyltransferase
MPLPEIIEVVPLDRPVRATVRVPGSKSITNRALVLAALAEGETTLRGALWSEDTQVMVECLQELGFLVTVAADPGDPANRTITVYGQGGRVPRGGTETCPMELFVGNAGTAARFLTALVCLGEGVYRLSGVPRMHERPQAALVSALRELGYRVDTPDERLPLRVHGGGPRPGARCRVDSGESSQFASALLLAGRTGGWQPEIPVLAGEEMPYVEMTRQLVASFPHGGGEFVVEPDASSGSYFWAADWLLGGGGSQVGVADWPESGWQRDADFPACLRRWRAGNYAEVSRARDLADSIMTAIVLAPWAAEPVRFTDLGRLRVQECERVLALRTELTRCGARVVESGDTLEVFPSALHGATIQTYEDHRMAMCFAVLGLKVPGIRIQHPECVRKTFPNFFQKLAAPAPRGLGAVILDGTAARQRALGEEELGAD